MFRKPFIHPMCLCEALLSKSLDECFDVKFMIFGSDRSPRCQDVCVCVCLSMTFFKRELQKGTRSILKCPGGF